MKRSILLLGWLTALAIMVSGPLQLLGVRPPSAAAQSVSIGDLNVVAGVQDIGTNVKWPQVATYGNLTAAVGAYANGTATNVKMFTRAGLGNWSERWSTGLGERNDFSNGAVALNDTDIYVATTDPKARQVKINRFSVSAPTVVEKTWTISSGKWPTNPILAIGKGNSSDRLMLVWRDDYNAGDLKPGPHVVWIDNASGSGTVSSRLRIGGGTDAANVGTPGLAAEDNGDFAITWARATSSSGWQGDINTAIWRESTRTLSNIATTDPPSSNSYAAPSVAYSPDGGKLYVAYRGNAGAWLQILNPNDGTNKPTVSSTLQVFNTSTFVDGRINVTVDDTGRIHITTSAGTVESRCCRKIFYGVIDGSTLVGQLGGYYDAQGPFQNSFAAATSGQSNAYNHVVFEAFVSNVPKLRTIVFSAPPLLTYGAAPNITDTKVGGDTTEVTVNWSGIDNRPDGLRYGWTTNGTTTWLTSGTSNWSTFTKTLTTFTTTVSVPEDWQSAVGCVSRTFRSEFRKVTTESGVTAWSPSAGTDTVQTDYHVGAATTISSTLAVSVTGTITNATLVDRIWDDAVRVRSAAYLDNSLSPDGKLIVRVVRSSSTECSNLTELRVGVDESGADAATPITLGGTTAIYTRTVDMPGYSPGDAAGDYPVVLRVDDSMGNKRYYSYLVPVDGTGPDVSSVDAGTDVTATASLQGDIAQTIEVDLTGVDLDDVAAVLVTTSFDAAEADVHANTARNWRLFLPDNVIDGSTLRIASWSLMNAVEDPLTNGTFNTNALSSAPETGGTVYISLMDSAGNLSDPIVKTIATSWETIDWFMPFVSR